MFWLMDDEQYHKALNALKFYQHTADNAVVMARLKTKWMMNGEHDKLIKNWRKFT